MGTWESENPELWQACTEGYGEGWWDRTVEDIALLEESRVRDGQCAFCGKDLRESEEACVALPPFPWVGAFCCEQHATNQLLFYCIREGK